MAVLLRDIIANGLCVVNPIHSFPTATRSVSKRKSRKSANAPAAVPPSMRARKTTTALTGTALLSCGKMTVFLRTGK